MVQGRDSAASQCTCTSVVAVLLLVLIHCVSSVDAAIYTVGDDAGWKFNTNAWPNGKTFKAGDVLVFKYNPQFHNVVIVDQNGHDTCTAPEGAPKFKTGVDHLTLNQGPNFFICTVPGHCNSGMKISVNAE